MIPIRLSVAIEFILSVITGTVVEASQILFHTVHVIHAMA